MRNAIVVWLSLSCLAIFAQSWSEGAGFRSLEVRPRTHAKSGFIAMAPESTGVRFTNVLLGDALLTNLVAHNGAGVAIGDADHDGWTDLYFCNLQGANRLYRNLGQWQFEEINIGEAACADQLSTGATFADVDGDGDLDLLVNGIAAGTRLFINDGKGRFKEAKTPGLSPTASATSLALADMDGDGDLDLYCTHYIDAMLLSDPMIRFALMRRGNRWEITKVNGEPTQLPRWKDRFEALEDGKVRELPERDGLYRNDGLGHFTPIQDDPGVFCNEKGIPIPPFREWGLSVMFRDINGDRAPDLYICNDNASPDRVWINSGQGAFRLVDPVKFRHTSRSSMGIDCADLDRDGYDDILVLDMLGREHNKRMTQLMRDLPDPSVRDRIEEQPRYNRNTLFFGQPDGTYVEAAFMAGVAASDWSFCPIFIDVDLDGYEDLLISNGFSLDVMDQDSNDEHRLRQRQIPGAQRKPERPKHPVWPTRNAAFRNRGDGTFQPMDREWGFDFLGISHGMALGDLDNDGDLDVVVNNLNDAAILYRNDASAERIAVRLKGQPPNTQGVGARLRLVGGSIIQSQEMICGGRYCSGDQAMRVFAAKATPGKPLHLEVRWRNGDLSDIEVQPNRIYEINQASSGNRREESAPPRSKPFFADASALLAHNHIDDAFDDWTIQALLPRRLSRLGPGLSWYDVNGDGWEDLIVSSGRGGKLAVCTNDQGKQFRPIDGMALAPTDQGAVLGWPDGHGNRQILVGVSKFGATPEQENGITAYSLTNVASPRFFPAGTSSPGPLTAADIDGDGDVDLFVGGRFCPGRYPEPVSSIIWLNEQGELRPSSQMSQPFESIGLVSGAAFGDFDGDGDPDLALAVEWGSVRVFRNEKGHFKDCTESWGFAGTSGWWTSVAIGDFDSDGRLDLVLGNWGCNSFYELYQPSPLRIFYFNENSDDALELIEAWRNAGVWMPVRHRLWLEVGLPGLHLMLTNHAAFSKASVQDILNLRCQEAKWVEAGCLESSVFLNRGSHFERKPLPREAQLSPAFSINVGDFDGDGVEDLFLAQNFFGAASDISRDDSGRGLWLRGTGTGTFTAIDGSRSGVVIYGEQRGAALADFNHDGRVDLAVSQNNAATKLFVNQSARRGVRVALHGSAANPDAVGAQIRLLYANGEKGPCRLVQAGSGYWSQDAPTHVLGPAKSPAALWVRWPGGQEQTVSMQPDMWNIDVTLNHE